MNQVLEWVKKNVLIVVFVFLMIAAPVGMFIVASGMNKGVRDQVTSRYSDYPKLTAIEKTSISSPGAGGQETQGVVNDELLKRYEQVAVLMGEDAQKVHDAALAFNKKDHALLLPSLFPAPAPELAEVLPRQFHDRLIAAYENLLASVEAGEPSGMESLQELLRRERSIFITQTLQKEDGDQLTDDEAKRLGESLAEIRMGQYRERAEQVRMYASLPALNVPAWDQARQPTLPELFRWQWQYWVTTDIMRALADANGGDPSVIRAPVKRLLNLSVVNIPGAGVGSSGGGSSGSGRAGAGGAGFGAGGNAGGIEPQADPSAASGAVQAMPIDPKAPIAPDYSASFTGRKTCPLYDVINVELDMVVETARLPQVIDALAKRNFMTVVDMVVAPADSFAALEYGYFYGADHVSTVWMKVETVWLRSWTSESMPDELRSALGIAPKPAMPGGAPVS